MHDGSRIAAGIELVTDIVAGFSSPKSQPADGVMGYYFKGRRYIGAKDRGSIAELVYFIIRHYAALRWWVERGNLPVTGRTLVIAALALRSPALLVEMDGNDYSPAPLTPDEQTWADGLQGQSVTHTDMPTPVRCNFPTWLEDPLWALFATELPEEMAALNQEAPVDLRANRLKATREQLIDALQKEGFDATPTPLSPVGVRLSKRNAAFTTQAFKDGWFEMQDEGSQIVALMTEAKPGQKIIDFCAGAGGKTLAIAANMKNKGQILAWDTSEKRLDQIKPRIKRAGVDNVRVHAITTEHDAFIKRHKASADWVLVDAPCSGSGTWRRNPDSKWRLTPESLAELCDLQGRILESAARLVKPGGFLVYATCSLLESENERRIADFLTKSHNFKVATPAFLWNKSASDDDKSRLLKGGSYLRLTPLKDGTDGFFAALLQRTSVGKEAL